MSEQKRVQLFQDKFQRVKNDIGYLILDRKAQDSLLSELTSGTDAQYEIYLQELPVMVFYEGQVLNKRQQDVVPRQMIVGDNVDNEDNEDDVFHGDVETQNREDIQAGTEEQRRTITFFCKKGFSLYARHYKSLKDRNGEDY